VPIVTKPAAKSYLYSAIDSYCEIAHNLHTHNFARCTTTSLCAAHQLHWSAHLTITTSNQRNFRPELNANDGR